MGVKSWPIVSTMSTILPNQFCINPLNILRAITIFNLPFNFLNTASDRTVQTFGLTWTFGCLRILGATVVIVVVAIIPLKTMKSKSWRILILRVIESLWRLGDIVVNWLSMFFELKFKVPTSLTALSLLFFPFLLNYRQKLRLLLVSLAQIIFLFDFPIFVPKM